MPVAKGWTSSALAALLSLACARSPAPEPAIDARRAVLPPDASTAADALPSLAQGLGLAAAGGATGKCGEIEAAWTKRRATGGRCAAAADCACYTASLWAPFGRDATDVATAKALGMLAWKFSSHPCPTACVQGIPDRCKADCVDGRCVAVHLPPDHGQRRRRAR
jgi:hypothetical protein